MKITKSILFLCFLAFAFAGCNKDELAELNDNTKEPTEVSGEYLFSNAQQALSDQIASTNVNRNIFKLVAQYWTETQYPDEGQWNLAKRNIPRQVWSAYYRDVLMDLNRAKSLMSEQTITEGLPADEAAKVTAKLANKLAIADILMVMTYQRLVDTFGNIPYSQSLDIDATTTPAYDDAESVYKQLFDRLDVDISKLNASYESYKPDEEYIYKGDVAKWITFANSLKFKMAIIVQDVPSLNPSEKAQAAFDAGIISDPMGGEDAIYNYSTGVPNTNPLWEDLVASGRTDFVAANTIVDTLNALDDPRRKYFFDGNIEDGDGNPIYIGGNYADHNGYDTLSHVSQVFNDPTYPNTLMDYTEMQFYLAEANASNLISTGSAESYYNEGIKSSILSWGGTEDEASDYIATVPYDDSNWRQSIGFQEWIAFYSRGFEGWTTIRRCNLIEFMNYSSEVPVTLEDFPLRFNYPVEEQTLNGPNYQAAAAAMGGDLKTTRLFWDKD